MESYTKRIWKDINKLNVTGNLGNINTVMSDIKATLKLIDDDKEDFHGLKF